MPAMPARYTEAWRGPFDERLAASLRPGMAILDVGSGRRPTVSPENRPPGTRYVGLDISAAELALAPPGSYDETFVADAVRRVPELEGRFDLIVSWQVLEHVKPLEAAFENFRAYLKPGGHVLTQFSGTFSYFALVSRLIPRRVTAWLVHRFEGRDASAVFPAHYHDCWYSRITEILRPWSSSDVVPRYRGANYLHKLGPIRSLYLIFENWLVRSGRRNLATHYLVRAQR